MTSAEAMPAVPSAGDRINAALWFAGIGFGCFPVWSTRDGQCRCPAGPACTAPGKHPITTDGFKSATTDPERIRTFLSARSEPNYGMVPPDGVFIWDVDTDDERGRLATLEARHGALPATLRDDTGNGQHLFLRWPDGLPRPLHKMFGFVTRWGSGSMQGYVVGPLSIHVSGRVYRSAKGSAKEIATLPESWARAAVEGDTGSITFQPGGSDAASIQPGGRHDWLRDRARFYAGTLREPDVLFAAVWAENLHLSQPKTEDEVRRAIGDALTKFPADPVEVDAETGELRRVRNDDGDMLTDDVVFPFPPPPDRVAFEGLAGDMVAAVLDGTDASEVALMASVLAMCGALVPSRAYFGRTQMSAPHIALVGESSIGRKGTAMTRAQDTLASALGTQVVNRALLDGVNSGEGLVTALEHKQTQYKREPTTGVLFEEEFATLLSAAARDGSSLDSRLRQAFDGGPLSNRKASSTQTVEAPYWLSALVGITPSELQEKGPSGALQSGSANRWLWLPVVRRDADVVNTEPILPDDLRRALLAAYEAAHDDPPTLAHTEEASKLLTAYGKHLVKDATGLSRDLSRRYPIIAFRIAMIHATLDRSSVVTTGHIERGIALTEYAREGTPWVFGYTVGNELATLILRHLREVGSLTRRQITQDWARDPIKRQRALDELRRLGFAEVVKVSGTGGRARAELRLVQGRASFVHFVRSGQSVPDVQDVHVNQTHETLRTHGTTETHGMHESARNRPNGGPRVCPVCHQQHPVGTTCDAGGAA